MSKLCYTQEDFEKIINIFSSHNVRLEFENLQQLYSAIHESGKYFHSKQLRAHFDRSRSSILLEFDVLNRKMLSVGRNYPNSTLNICEYTEVANCLFKFKDIFSMYPGEVLGYFNEYCIMTSPDDKLQKIYFMFFLLLSDIAEDSLNDFLSILNLSSKNIDFLKLHHDRICFHYYGFDVDMSTDNVGFILDKNISNFDLIRIYSDYIGIENVIKTCKNFFTKEDDGFMLQYNTKNQSYFTIEMVMENIEECKNFYYLMYKNSIISKNEYENFMDMNISFECESYFVKFKWTDENTFVTKLYLSNIVDSSDKILYNSRNATDQ